MKPAQVQRIVRRLTLLLVAAGGFYLYSRFDMLVLPAEGCTPVSRYAPGTRLLLDTRPSGYELGDGVLFQSAPGVISLGLLDEIDENGEYWIAVDAADCPATSSAELGWIAQDRLVARVVLATSL